MYEELLQEIGLTDAETKVYLALLELGSSSTGKIVDTANVASSKIYHLLDRLGDKGLVSFVKKGTIKFYEAAPPDRILDYLNEKEASILQQKKSVQDALPELKLKQELSKYSSEAVIYRGIKGLQTAFYSALSEMKKGEEFLGMDLPQRSKAVNRFFVSFAKEKARRDINSKLIFNEAARGEDRTRKENRPLTELRFSPTSNPSSINIFSKQVIIFPSEVTEPLLIVIRNKEVVESFKNQFYAEWNKTTVTFEGAEAVKSLYNEIVANATEKDELIMFAAKPKQQDLANFNLNFVNQLCRRISKVRTIYFGSTEENIQRTKAFEKVGALTKIVSTQQILPISTLVIGDTVYNTVWEPTPVIFKIQNKIIADSYRSNFESLWSQDVTVEKGLDAVQQTFDEMLASGHGDFIAARGYFMNGHPEYAERWKRAAIASGFTMRNLVDPEVKGHTITTMPFAQTKYTLQKEFAKLSVFWIYGNKVAISNWAAKEPIVIKIDNKNIHDVFKKQFELLWNQKTVVETGMDAFERMFESIFATLKKGETYRVLGATHHQTFRKEKYISFFKRIHTERRKLGINVQLLFYKEDKAFFEKHGNETPGDKAQYKFLPYGSVSPVTWYIFKEATVIVIQDQGPTIITINNKDITKSFEQHFDSLWKEK